MKFLLISALQAVSIVALAVRDPQITPPVLVPRQAGLDEFYSSLGGPNEFIVTNLGPSNSLLSYNGKSYHYIEGHTKYFSEVITTTINNAPKTTTTTANVVASTAAEAVGDLAAGDLAVTFSEDIASALTEGAKNAANVCGITAKPKKLKRQDPISCLIDHAIQLSGKGGPFEGAATEQWWENLVIKVADNAPTVLTNALQVVKSQAQKNKLLLSFAAIVSVPVLVGSVAILRISAKGVGSKTETEQCPPEKNKKDENSSICQHDDCKGDPKSQVCSVGPDKGCPCVMDYSAVQDDIDKDWADFQQQILAKLSSGQLQADLAPKPECNLDDSSQIPFNVFQPTVYQKFCDERSKRDPKSTFTQIVTSTGDVIPPRSKAKSKRHHLFGKRTPPPNPDTYADYNFELSWSGGDGRCPYGDCTQAFHNISQSPCGHTGGTQNIMATTAKIDTGCGIYSYKIDIPHGAKPPTVQPIHCFDNPDNDPAVKKCWKPVKQKEVDDTASWMNDHQLGFLDMNNNHGMMYPNSGNVTQVIKPEKGGLTYMMVIAWIPGCKNFDKLDARNPIPSSMAINWSDLIKDNYYKCTANKGRGGYTDVGCLRYGFYPNNAGTFGNDKKPHPEKFFDKMSYCG